MGIVGLDAILDGGLPRNHLYLIDGEPGAGKTTLGLQFLFEGAAKGERGLYVTLSESRSELESVANSHGWNLEGVEIFELASQQAEDLGNTYTVFYPAEVELQQTMEAVLKVAESKKPQRMVFDSLSEMRLLAREPLRFRRQILALKQFFSGRDCTVLLLDDKSAPEGDLQLQSLAHGVILLEHVALEYGAERRRIQVRKVRGLQFRGGYHDFRLTTGGLQVYPRILHDGPRADVDRGVFKSGSGNLDELLGGGIVCGTSMLITGAAGTGKSVLATELARASLRRGDKVRFYLFDERVSTFVQRSDALEMSVRKEMKSGQLTLRQVEPTDLSPGEFASEVVRAVLEDGVKLVVIDSINGYMQSMPEERLLPIQIHELLSFLSNNGVTCIMSLVQHGIFGSPVDEAVDVSYLADAVILMRYFEVRGSVRQAISVVKKRTGNHERTIREFKVGKGGLVLGDPLTAFHGVLTGVPEYKGGDAPLMERAGKLPRKKKSKGSPSRKPRG